MTSCEQEISPFFVPANLTNEAASQMDRGNYLVASQQLAGALCVLKKTLKGQNIQSSGSASQAAAIFVCAFSEDTPAMIAQSESDSMQVSDCFIFKRPIQIYARGEGSAETAISAEIVLSYSIVYNLALCHHLQGIAGMATGEENSERYVRKAIELYTYAQQVLARRNNEDLLLGDIMLHTLANLNNLGHAYHMLHNEPTAKLCFEELLTVIMQMQRTDRGGNRRDIFGNHNPSLDGFLSNTMTLIVESLRAAPAA
jgi:hypothetical protein